MSYPRFGYFRVDGFEGHASIFKGHNIDDAAIAAEVGSESFKRSEVYFHFHPRIKWCERIGAGFCEEEGEWHSHYIEARPSVSAAYTVAWSVP